MRKTIIAICNWIIAKLEVNANRPVRSGKYRVPHKTMKNYPKGSKRKSYHRGCWVITPCNKSWYPTQQQAADAIAKAFDLDIYRHDVYNALYHKDGELWYGKRYLCRISYTKD